MNIDNAVIHGGTVALDKCSKGAIFAKLRNDGTTLYIPGLSGCHRTNGPSAALFWDMHVNPDSGNKICWFWADVQRCERPGKILAMAANNTEKAERKPPFWLYNVVPWWLLQCCFHSFGSCRRPSTLRYLITLNTEVLARQLWRIILLKAELRLIG